MAALRKGHIKVVKWMVNHVTQFPSDQEMTRYISTINEKDLLDRCDECIKIIKAAKETQAAKANKNASILLEELDMEKTREESKKAAAARRRERKRKKKFEKKEEKRKLQQNIKTNVIFEAENRCMNSRKSEYFLKTSDDDLDKARENMKNRLHITEFNDNQNYSASDQWLRTNRIDNKDVHFVDSLTITNDNTYVHSSKCFKQISDRINSINFSAEQEISTSNDQHTFK